MARSSYIDSYDDISVHELMLKDEPRTRAYMDFMLKNKDFFKGKVVMDVGSGTGILSMFAARAGAKKVYAVEASDMRLLSEKIIRKNKLEGVVEVLGGRVEEVELEGKVDVIVSEWMGFYLLHESMLSSVLVARDRFLDEDGIILPSCAALYAAPSSLRALHRHLSACWNDVYGFNFSAVVDEMFDTRLHQQPLVDVIPSCDILSAPHTLAVLDLRYADPADFETITSTLKFTLNQHGVCRGVTLWFDVHFSLGAEYDDSDGGDDGALEPTHSTGDDANTTPADTNNNATEGSHGNKQHASNYSTTTTLSTSPFSSPTHWKQTTILLPTPLLLSKGDSFECSLMLQRGGDDDDPEKRRYKITLILPEEDGDDDDVCIIGAGDEFDESTTDLIMKAINK